MLVRKLQFLLEINEKFSREDVEALVKLVSYDLALIIEDLKKDSHYGFRKLDINLLYNMPDYSEAMTYDQLVVLWNNLAKRVKYNKIAFTFLNDTVLELTFDELISDNTSLFQFLNTNTVYKSTAKNTILLPIEHPVTSTITRFLDSVEKISGVRYIQLFAAGGEVAKDLTPVYTWKDTTSYIEVVGSNISQIYSVAEALNTIPGSLEDAILLIKKAAADALKHLNELKNLSIAVLEAPYGQLPYGSYNPDTGMLTLAIPEGKIGQTGPKGDKGNDGIDGKDGKNGIDGVDGATGLSAYMLAVQQGYNGTLPDWLISLQGQDAYELAVEYGFNGTIYDWFLSLHGKDGENGRDSTAVGPKGDVGMIMAGDWPLVFGNMFAKQDGYLYLNYAGNHKLDEHNFFIDDDGYLKIDADESDPLHNIYPAGKSAYELAYELAVLKGFVGTIEQWMTLEEWIESLRGPLGLSYYELAVENGFTGTLEEWLESLGAIHGLSAYEIAVKLGFIGTEQEWLDSLKGNLDWLTDAQKDALNSGITAELLQAILDALKKDNVGDFEEPDIFDHNDKTSTFYIESHFKQRSYKDYHFLYLPAAVTKYYIIPIKIEMTIEYIDYPWVKTHVWEGNYTAATGYKGFKMNANPYKWWGGYESTDGLHGYIEQYSDQYPKTAENPRGKNPMRMGIDDGIGVLDYYVTNIKIWFKYL